MEKWLYPLVFLTLTLTMPVSAQTGARFGIRAGYSLATQYGILEPDIPYDVDVYYRHAAAGGFFVYYPITESFGVQQEFLFTMKGSREDIVLKDRPINTRTEYDINYFEIPILFRYTFARIGKIGIYGCSGFTLSIFLSGEYRLSGLAEVDDEPVAFHDKNKIDGVDIFDYGFLYGSGVEGILFGRRCFFEYRFTLGWNVLNMPTAEGEDPAPLRNMDYLFTVGMYF
ncbi:PorT family protein [bacterium]|nr:PorT family protein [bacterium]